MLIVNTITQSGAFDYTQSVRSGAFVTLVIEHCLTAFFDVSNHQHSLISVTAFSKLVNEQLSQRVFKLKYVISKYTTKHVKTIYLHAPSCSQVVVTMVLAIHMHV